MHWEFNYYTYKLIATGKVIFCGGVEIIHYTGTDPRPGKIKTSDFHRMIA